MKRILKKITPKTKEARWLLVLTFPVWSCLLLVGFFYTVFIITGNEEMPRWIQGILTPFMGLLYLFVYLIHLSIFYYPYLFVTLFITGLVIIRKNNHLIWKLFFGVIGCLIVWQSLEYRPHIEPTEQYTYQLADRPFLFEAGRKKIRTFAEIEECDYEILGWQNSTLYYKSDCVIRKGMIYAFHAETGKRKRVKTIPDNLLLQESIIDRKTPFNDNIMGLYLRTPLYSSADFQYNALIIQDTYAPEDVMILQEKEPTGEQS